MAFKISPTGCEIIESEFADAAADTDGLVADESSPGVGLTVAGALRPQLPGACRVCSILVFDPAARPPPPLHNSLPFSLPRLRELGRENV